MALWFKAGSAPRELPFQDRLDDGTILTNLADNPDSREALGWIQAPDEPNFDPLNQGLRWTEDLTWEVVSIVPRQVSRMQAFYILKVTPGASEGRTLFQDFDDAIRASEDIRLINYWDTASDFHRDHPALTAFLASIGMSSDKVDDLFLAAGQVQ